MISDSYLAAARTRLNGISVEVRSIEGKNYVELVRESAKGYDLTVIGARGLGLASVNGGGPPGTLGSVCERFCRRCRTDILVVKNARRLAGNMLACVDGSPESYAALRKALKLAGAVGGCVEAVTCFDPDYHPVAFEAIAKVLSEKDAKMFRFKEQEKLHDNIINRGLENLYQGYLENARVVAKGRGFSVETRLLTGKPAYEIAARAREVHPTLVVVARFGLHRTDDSDIGSTAETVVRLAGANVLVVNEKPAAEGPLRALRVSGALRGVPRPGLRGHRRSPCRRSLVHIRSRD
jgi:nucleotide-binding universal stress UspA family protein